MESKTYNISFNTNYLEHIGNKNSGRYPRGSGENPYQHEGIKYLSSPEHYYAKKHLIRKGTAVGALEGAGIGLAAIGKAILDGASIDDPIIGLLAVAGPALIGTVAGHDYTKNGAKGLDALIKKYGDRLTKKQISDFYTKGSTRRAIAGANGLLPTAINSIYENYNIRKMTKQNMKTYKRDKKLQEA